MNCQGALKKRLGLGPFALSLVNLGPVAAGGGDAEIIFLQGALAKVQGPLEKGIGLFILALVVAERCQVVHS